MRQVIRIDILPDDVLLEIFDFYLDISLSSRYRHKTEIEAWKRLVHVCRRWRSLVLESPRRLNLRLCCTPETPVRDTLDVWPALPLIVAGNMALSSDMDDIIAALGQSNRVCQVDLCALAHWQLGEVLAAMQAPFPELTDLRLDGGRQFGPVPLRPVIPDSFSAPRLRIFTLSGIPFLGLPNLLLSATHLVTLSLSVPDSQYISPEAAVALLSVLTSLETLILVFHAPHYLSDRGSRSLPPPKRSVLPALEEFRFKGFTKYLEELVTRIDTPRLDKMRVAFFNDFDCPQLVQFINCTPTLRAHDEAHVIFEDRTSVAFLARSRTLEIKLSLAQRGLSSVPQVCNSLPSPSTVGDLYIERQPGHLQLFWTNDAIEATLWLELLLPFTALKNLYLSEELAPGIAAALQELVGGRITEALPSLQNIFVEGLELSGPFQENIGQFIAARQLSGHPIAISIWDKDSNTKIDHCLSPDLTTGAK